MVVAYNLSYQRLLTENFSLSLPPSLFVHVLAYSLLWFKKMNFVCTSNFFLIVVILFSFSGYLIVIFGMQTPGMFYELFRWCMKLFLGTDFCQSTGCGSQSRFCATSLTNCRSSSWASKCWGKSIYQSGMEQWNSCKKDILCLQLIMLIIFPSHFMYL